MSKVSKKEKKAKKKEQQQKEEEESKDIPKTFIFHIGKVVQPIKKLEDDVRQAFAPWTALNLRVDFTCRFSLFSHLIIYTQKKPSSKNVLKDYTVLAGPFGITHFLIFTQTTLSTNLRIAKYVFLNELKTEMFSQKFFFFS